MNTDLEAKCIGQSVSNRSRIALSLLKQLTEQDEADKVLKEKLLHAAPKTLHKWLKEDCILNNLFEHGKSSGKIYFHGDYNFGNITDVKNKMNQLAKAWKKIVLITVSKSPGTHRVEVRLTAII